MKEPSRQLSIAIHFEPSLLKLFPNLSAYFSNPPNGSTKKGFVRPNSRSSEKECSPGEVQVNYQTPSRRPYELFTKVFSGPAAGNDKHRR
jgi:hypothetical protein